MVLSGRQQVRENRPVRRLKSPPPVRGATMFRPLAVAALLVGASAVWGQEKPTVIPPPTLDGQPAASASEKAVLAGGCYWGTQGIFEHVKGIERVVAGFTA